MMNFIIEMLELDPRSAEQIKLNPESYLLTYETFKLLNFKWLIYNSYLLFRISFIKYCWEDEVVLDAYCGWLVVLGYEILTTFVLVAQKLLLELAC